MNNHTSRYSFLTRPAGLARGNVTTEVTNTIRNAIVTLALPPGSTIDKSLICAELGVSRFPVSEALARLQTEGLVDIAPQRGSTVSLVKLADVREYMLIRKGLESEALRVLIGSHDAGLVDALHANISDRARRLIITPRRLALTIDEHQAIFDGILAQDQARAAGAIRAHIDAVMVELFAFAREHPDLFADGATLGTDSDSFPFG